MTMQNTPIVEKKDNSKYNEKKKYSFTAAKNQTKLYKKANIH